MPADPSCVLCKIAAGQIPCFKVYEDEIVIAFLDIAPLVVGHTLIIPKAHHPTVMETPPDLLAAVNRRIPAITRSILAATGAVACHLLANNGSQAMQSVSHLHYHVLPRRPGDGFAIPWKAGTLDAKIAAPLAATILAQLNNTEIDE